MVIARQIYEYCKSKGKEEEDINVLCDALNVSLGKLLEAASAAEMQIDLIKGKIRI